MIDLLIQDLMGEVAVLQERIANLSLLCVGHIGRKVATTDLLKAFVCNARHCYFVIVLAMKASPKPT